jgi:hypothetical protein
MHWPRYNKLGSCGGQEVFSTGECLTLIETSEGFQWVRCLMLKDHVGDDIHRAVKQGLQTIRCLEDAGRSNHRGYSETEGQLEEAAKFLESTSSHIQNALFLLKKEREKKDKA